MPQAQHAPKFWKDIHVRLDQPDWKFAEELSAKKRIAIAEWARQVLTREINRTRQRRAKKG